MKKANSIDAVIKNIESIKWGRLKIERNSIIESNDQFIQIIKSDEDGHLYFFVSGSGNSEVAVEQKYYANLIFEDKPEEIRIQISGYVYSVANNFEIDITINSRERNYLLLKFKIMQVEFIDFKLEEKNKTQPILSNLLNLFRKNS